MASLPDGGGGTSLDDKIMGAQWRLWMATIEENGSVQAAGGYVVDPERAEECIREMTRIANDVRLTILQPGKYAFTPPGHDVVSQNVAKQGSIMGQRAEIYIATWANQIEVTRDALVAQLAAYREVERANTARRA
jgi:hypothetical protein